MAYRYVKQADRHKPRKAAEGRRVRCSQCNELTFTPYWWNCLGQPRLDPLCPECHEREVLRMVREERSEARDKHARIR
jgi:formylmethanofuran dehydrogenase subunit E